MARNPKLFQPITFRSVTARNRIVVAPMCQYSADDGLGNDWHVQHLGARAAGGAGIVLTEATHVSALGRITPGCLGLWDDEQALLLKRLVGVIELCGAVPGMQIAHAGRKASSMPPWKGGGPIAVADGGWQPWGPSAIPFSDQSTVPHAMSVADIADVIGQFRASAAMARDAGMKVIEVHAAHGYLLHSFLSPLSNIRNDQYGGDLAGRARALMETVDAIREEWPDELPLFVRVSAVDWMAGGLTIEDTVEVSRMLKATGKVDLIDCSSGGILASGPVIPSLHPGYQVPFAEAVRHQAGIATGAVGLITAPEHAEEILGNERADLIFVARAILADPTWPLKAAVSLGQRWICRSNIYARPFVRIELAALLLIGAAAAPPDVSVSPDGDMGLIEWGIFVGEDTGVAEAKDTVAGTMHQTGNLSVVRQTTDICAQIGTRFGMRYRLEGQPTGLPWVLEIRTDHPMLHAPSGKSGDHGSYKRLMRRGTWSYTGWSVDQPYEMVPGDYTFTLIQNDQVMLRKTFHVSFDCTPPVS